MGYYLEEVRQWVFDSVYEFWQSDIPGKYPGPSAIVEKDYEFWAKLSKGLTDDAFNKLKDSCVVLDNETQRLSLTVEQVHNPSREHNFRCLADPPPRTGNFDRFMDEVESFAKESGLRLILIDKVATKFLRGKFLRRGYKIIDYGFRENPDYIMEV